MTGVVCILVAPAVVVVAVVVKVAVAVVLRLAVVFAIEAAVAKTMVISDSVGRRAEKTDSRAYEIGQRFQARERV